MGQHAKCNAGAHDGKHGMYARTMGQHTKRNACAHDGKRDMYARTMSQHAKMQCRGSQWQAWQAWHGMYDVRTYDGPARENAMLALTTASMACMMYARTMGQHAKTQCQDSRRQAWHAHTM